MGQKVSIAHFTIERSKPLTETELWNRIHQELRKKERKLILLGGGMSGKSTIFKQIRYCVQGDPSETERMNYLQLLQSNAISSAQKLIQNMEFDDPELQAKQNEIMSWDRSGENFEYNMDKARLIYEIWQREDVKEHFKFVMARSCISYAATNYFENCLNYAGPSFVPTMEDCLSSRAKSSGIDGFSPYRLDGLHIIDTAGENPARRNWIYGFENYPAVVFVVSLAEYARLLVEDESIYKIHDSLTLFKTVVNTRWLKKSRFVLIFTMNDLFEKMLQDLSLSETFPDYRGGPDVNAATDFIVNKFLGMVHQPAHVKSKILVIRQFYGLDRYFFPTIWNQIMDHCFNLWAYSGKEIQNSEIKLAMLLLLKEAFYQLPNNPKKLCGKLLKTYKFFQIMLKMPLEIQMRICNLCSNITKPFVSDQQIRFSLMCELIFNNFRNCIIKVDKLCIIE